MEQKGKEKRWNEQTKQIMRRRQKAIKQRHESSERKHKELIKLKKQAVIYYNEEKEISKQQ